jgi:CubicO group peptidase (beta-lactamase class C family)
MLVLFFGISCSQNGPNQIEQRIHHIENGLIEFKSPESMLQPDSEQLANPKILAERMEHYKIPGVSIAVINDYRIDWTKAYGTLDVNTGAPLTTETIFEAASTSKFITSVMALNFVQKGLIALDTNVNDYLKSWQIPDNEFTKDEKVTLRRILTHRAGMPTTNFDYDEDVGIPTLIDVLSGTPPAENKPAIPELVPGSQWQYSNVAYDVIQLLLEDVSGKPFQQIAEEIIFEPLGMNHSTFVYPLNSEKKIHEALPHDAEGISREPAMHLTAFAHGNLTTTPTDLAKFTLEIMLSYQGKSEKILSQRTAKLLFNKECEIDQKAIPLPFFEGLGVFLMGEGKDLVFTHPGENFPGFICWLIGWPERGTAAVIMINGAQGFMLAMEIISAINLEYNKTQVT